MRSYELTFVVRSDISEEALNNVIEQVQGWITAEGNEIVRVDRWGRRRLAYTINNQREGHYILIEAVMATETLGEIERNLKLSDAVMRYLLVHAEE